MKAIVLVIWIVVIIVLIYIALSKIRTPKGDEDVKELEKILLSEKEKPIESISEVKKESTVELSILESRNNNKDIEEDIPTGTVNKNEEKIIDDSVSELSTVGMTEEFETFSKEAENISFENNKILLEYRVYYQNESQKTIAGEIRKKELEDSYIIGRSKEHCDLVIKEQLPPKATKCNIGTVHVKLTYQEIGEERVFKVEKTKVENSKSGDYLYVRSNAEEEYQKVYEEQFDQKIEIRLSVIYGDVVLALGIPGSLEPVSVQSDSTIVNGKQKKDLFEKEDKVKWKMPSKDPWKRK